MATGKMTVTIVLKDPDETIINEEPVKFTTDKELASYGFLQVAKVREFGGVLQNHGPFDVELIPIERVKSVRAVGTKDLIQGAEQVNEAIAEATFAKSLIVPGR